MSYYTVIYPIDDIKEIPSKEVCEKNIKEARVKLNDAWENIVALCAINPAESSKPIAYFKELFNLYYRDFIRCLQEETMCCFISQAAENKKYSEDKEDTRPCIMQNRFSYNSNPHTGIKECSDALEHYKDLLLVYVIANPKNIINDKDEEGGTLDVANSLIIELNNIRQAIEELYYDLKFSELCVKYWNTHEEG